MQASKGDRVIAPSHRVGGPDRHGEIVEVQGNDGRPPYLVRWNDSSGEHLFFPGPDTTIEPHTQKMG
jgi:Domain of unknown function (DUF1918)